MRRRSTALCQCLVKRSCRFFIVFEVCLVHLDCLRRTHGHTGHAPDTVMLPNWVRLVGVVLSAFTVTILSRTCTCSILQLCPRYILLCSVSLINLDRAHLYARTICDARVPIERDHRAVHAEWNELLSSGLVGFFDLFVFCGLCSSPRPHTKWKCWPSEWLCLPITC